MDGNVFSNLLLLAFSPFAGSFLAVLVDRLPRGEDWVRGRSACRHCGHRLGPADLLPLVSFALRRGRCAQCKSAIPAWLFYVELLALGVACLAVVKGGGTATVWLTAGALWLLLALAVADLLWMRLPDLLTAALLGIALWLAALPGGLNFDTAILGAALGAGSFWLLRWAYAQLRGREGLGLGDVKLMAGLGAFSGPYDLPLLVLVAALLALALAAFQRLSNKDALAAHRAVPFGASLSAAAALIWLLQPPVGQTLW